MYFLLKDSNKIKNSLFKDYLFPYSHVFVTSNRNFNLRFSFFYIYNNDYDAATRYQMLHVCLLCTHIISMTMMIFLMLGMSTLMMGTIRQ